MRRYQLYIFDLDGTLNRGDEPIPHAVETVDQLRKEGAKIRYVTNNATRNLDYFVHKLNHLGFEATRNEIETSATGAAYYCKDHHIQKVGILGENGLAQCLAEAGIKVLMPDEPWPHEIKLDPSLNPIFEPQKSKFHTLDAVVIGLFRTCTYAHISKGMQAISHGAQFIATNRDATFPLEHGRFIPGSGAMTAALAECSGQEPFVTGKPNPYLIERLMQAAGVPPRETLVVGDRLDTDIESGKRAKADTFLVLTGVETKAPKDQLWGDDLRALLQS